MWMPSGRYVVIPWTDGADGCIVAVVVYIIKPLSTTEGYTLHVKGREDGFDRQVFSLLCILSASEIGLLLVVKLGLML